MDNLKGLLGIRRMDRIPNAWIRELCRVTKGVDERINKDWWVENGRIAKRVYVGECAGSRSVGSPRKRWIDTVQDCLKRRGLDVRQVRRMVHDRSVWRGFVRGNAWGVARGMNPWPWRNATAIWSPWIVEVCSVAKHTILGHRGENFFLFMFYLYWSNFAHFMVWCVTTPRLR